MRGRSLAAATEAELRGAGQKWTITNVLIQWFGYEYRRGHMCVSDDVAGEKVRDFNVEIAVADRAPAQCSTCNLANCGCGKSSLYQTHPVGTPCWVPPSAAGACVQCKRLVCQDNCPMQEENEISRATLLMIVAQGYGIVKGNAARLPELVASVPAWNANRLRQLFVDTKGVTIDGLKMLSLAKRVSKHVAIRVVPGMGGTPTSWLPIFDPPAAWAGQQHLHGGRAASSFYVSGRAGLYRTGGLAHCPAGAGSGWGRQRRRRRRGARCAASLKISRKSCAIPNRDWPFRRQELPIPSGSWIRL